MRQPCTSSLFTLIISCKYLSTVWSWKQVTAPLMALKILFLCGVAADKIILKIIKKERNTPDILPIHLRQNWKMLSVEMKKCHVSCLCGTGGLTAWVNGIVSAPPSSLGKHQPGFQGADRLIWCDGVPCAWTCYPLGCRVNTVLCVDGHDGHSDHISSRSRKWELEGSCYQAPSFLPVLHRAKLKPCVFSPCGPPHTACLAGWLASAVVFWTCDLRKHSSPPSCHCYLNPPSV